MHFDFCIGNPPYQETKGGTKNIDVWPYFIKGANAVASNICYIHPGRWVVPKKQMVRVRDALIEYGLYKFDYIPNSDSVFPKLRGIDGGVTVSFFKTGYKGNIEYFVNELKFGYYDKNTKFFSNEYEKEVYNKIFSCFDGLSTMQDRIVGNIGSLGSSEFGYNKSKHFTYLKESCLNMREPIKIWAAIGFGKGTHYEWRYIDKKNLDVIPLQLLSSRKVMISKVGVPISFGKKAVGFNGFPQIVESNSIGENVYFVFPEEDSDYDLELIQSLFMTCTARFLMSITQKDLVVRGFENIPDYQLFKPMLKGKLFTDDFFFKNFGFSKELINHIEKSISVKMGILKGQLHK